MNNASRQITQPYKRMNNSITNSDIRSLRPLTPQFRPYRTLILTDYSTCTHKVIGKTVDLQQGFNLLHNGNWIDKQLVSWCYLTIENFPTQDQIQFEKGGVGTVVRALRHKSTWILRYIPLATCNLHFIISQLTTAWVKHLDEKVALTKTTHSP